ncbi:uncharacterized protein PG986_011657 [Apiospora aurea]|uniref:Uncharacterized protein n=1 Tax=Apiospora aurea TaxID=335848 RepID=A0ABR1PXR7_9PEZI
MAFKRLRLDRVAVPNRASRSYSLSVILSQSLKYILPSRTIALIRSSLNFVTMKRYATTVGSRIKFPSVMQKSNDLLTLRV